MPQGLLLLSAAFSCAMIALSQLMMVAMPTYSTYGSQHYSEVVNGTSLVKACDSHAPQGNGCFYKPSAHIQRTARSAHDGHSTHGPQFFLQVHQAITGFVNFRQANVWQAHFFSSILTILPKLSAKLGHLLFIYGDVGKVPIANI